MHKEIAVWRAQKPEQRNLIIETLCFWVAQRKESTWRMSDVTSSAVAIHVVAHFWNLQRYHWSQSAHSEGLPAALSKLGNAPNESYLNPIRTFYTVSPCMLPGFSSEKSFLFPLLYQESCVSKAINRRAEETFLPNVNINFTLFLKKLFFINVAKRLWARRKTDAT